MLWLAIHLPALPLQVFTRGMQSPLPIAIVAPPPRATILAATPGAEAAGIHCGQRSVSALTLLPELQHQRELISKSSHCLSQHVRCLPPSQRSHNHQELAHQS